jgi:hypothetical protein
MSAKPRNKILVIAIALLTLVWIVGVSIAATHYDKPCIGGVIATVIAILIAELYLLFVHKVPGGRAVEVSAIPLICTVSFFVVSLAVNTLFVFAKKGDFNPLLMVLNLIIDVIYIIILLFAEKSSRRLNSQLVRMGEKTQSPSELSHKLGNLLSIAEDDEVRLQLRKLKETVDYSSNLSSSKTTLPENQLALQLDEIMELIIGRTDSSAICKKIKEAEVTWKTRISAR